MSEKVTRAERAPAAGPDHPWQPLEEADKREPMSARGGALASVEGALARRSAAETILEELLEADAAPAGRPRRRKPADEPGFVLHARPWSESSLVADVLTPRFGRVFLVARGAKRPGSQLRGLLTPFTPLAFTWTGRREAKVITRAEWLGALPALQGESLISGFYINELIVRLTEREDPHPGLFSSYVRALSALADSQPAVRQAGLRRFEAELLAHCGWGLSVGETEAERFRLSLDGGLEPAPEGEGGWTRRVALAVSIDALADAGRWASLTPAEKKSARELLRAAIDLRLDGRPLRSRRILGDLSRF